MEEGYTHFADFCLHTTQSTPFTGDAKAVKPVAGNDLQAFSLFRELFMDSFFPTLQSRYLWDPWRVVTNFMLELGEIGATSEFAVLFRSDDFAKHRVASRLLISVTGFSFSNRIHVRFSIFAAVAGLFADRGKK